MLLIIFFGRLTKAVINGQYFVYEYTDIVN